jgi:hypothetical protein
MPNRTLFPNDLQDYYGTAYKFGDIEDRYTQARAGKSGDDNPVNQLNSETDHIKIQQQKINKQKLPIKNQAVEGGDKEKVEDKPMTENIRQEKEQEQKQEHSIFDYNKDGKIDTADLTGPLRDAGSSAYGLGEAGVKFVGESGGAILEKAKSSIVRSVVKEAKIDEKYDDAKQEALGQLDILKKEIKTDIEKKYEDLKKRTEEKSEEVVDNLKSIGYISVGVLFLFLLMKK